MTDLWPDFNDNEQNDNNSIEILREQARIIEKKTNKKIRATFSKIKYGQNMFETARVLSEYLGSNNLSELIEPELKKTSDINELFQKTKYKLEIYNETYRFRILTMEHSILYPANINVDGGIKEELSEGTNYTVTCDEDLEYLLKSIFHSKKIMTIISKMLRDADNTSKK